ncbi:MAG: OmpA family protein [Bacteriovoracaceae bacterium]|jgi:outer membrane protein OmpA-like peptidoglycan-associated protein|nr:OmpA family protein [Bacteriovoracaceae bacterium]
MERNIVTSDVLMSYKLLKPLLMLFIPLISYANINVQSFPFSDAHHLFLLEDGLLGRNGYSNPGQLFFKSSYSFLDDPLITVDAQRSSILNKDVKRIQTLQFGGGILFTRVLYFGIDSSYNFVALKNKSDSSIGDSTVFIKYRVFRSGDHAISFIPKIVLPTGDEKIFTSDGQLGAGFLFAYELDLGKFDFFANAGYYQNPDATFSNIDLRKRLISGLGLSFNFYPKWRLNFEWKGEFGLPFEKDQNPVEALLGARHQSTKNISSYLAFGVGGIDFAGETNTHSNDFRFLAGIKIITGAKVEEKPGQTKIVTIYTPIEIQREIRIFLLSIEEMVNFKKNSSTITEESKGVLKKLAKRFSDYLQYIEKITIEGHTDMSGPREFNRELSLERATSVKDYFVSEYSIKDEIFEVIGYGEDRPILQEYTSKEKAKNRRVQFNVKYR